MKKEVEQKADRKEESINPNTNKVEGNVADNSKDGSKGDHGDADNDAIEDDKIDEEDNEDESGNDDNDFDEEEIEDVEESEDYESMLESMRGVLNSTGTNWKKILSFLPPQINTGVFTFPLKNEKLTKIT